MNTYAPHPDTVSDWESIRRAVDARDSRLLERTFKWLATMPGSVRPMATARRFPHVANRLGELWPHCEFTRLYMQSLLIDRRGGRKGFPVAVRMEIETLQQYYFENLSGLPAILWNAVPLSQPVIPHKIFEPVGRQTGIEVRAMAA